MSPALAAKPSVAPAAALIDLRVTFETLPDASIYTGLAVLFALVSLLLPRRPRGLVASAVLAVIL